jgi:hypothetical protein
MNGTNDTDRAGTVDDSGDLDPREAALIVEQTAVEARRQFEPASPLVAARGAGLALRLRRGLVVHARPARVYGSGRLVHCVVVRLARTHGRLRNLT